MEPALFQLLSNMDGWQVSLIPIKAMTYGASFVASGGVFFLVLFALHLGEQEQRLIRRVVAAATLSGLCFSVLRIVVMSGMLTAEWTGMFDVKMIRAILESSEGHSTVLRLAGFALIGLLGGARIRGWLFVLPLLGAVLAATSFGLAGHAGELSNVAGPIPQWLICIHLLAIAFWLGALWPLYRLTYGSDIANVAAAMERFGSIAAFVVGTLVAVGVLLLWQMLGTVDALWLSAYGKLMLIKLAGVALMLFLATINKFRLTPRLRAGDRSGLTELRRSIAAEIVVAGLILLVTASVTTIAGPPTLT